MSNKSITCPARLEPKVSFGNKKLPDTTMIFNLPAVKTCPGKTSFCSTACYALKAERLYPQVYPARKHNLKLSLSENFVELMTDKINSVLHKINTVRIHESGDFYTQAYLLKWYEIALRFPKLKFYAYTKSFMLDFIGKPDNFVLIASFDDSSTVQAKLMYDSKRGYLDNTFSIVPKNAQASCIQDCTTCNACWMSKGLNITVNKH